MQWPGLPFEKMVLSIQIYNRKRMRGRHQVHGRSQIADFLCPDNGYRGQLKRQGKEVRDHMKENRVGLKEQQQRLRDKREAENVPAKELYKLQQFKDVAPRVFKPIEVNSNYDRRPSDGNINFLTKGESEKRREELRREALDVRYQLESQLKESLKQNDLLSADDNRPSTPRKPEVPRKTEIAKLKTRNDADFIERNRVKALTMAPPSLEKVEESAKHDEYGRIPAYLEERKAQWEEEKEERRKRQADPNCPKGMKLMPEDERLQTLEVLLTSKDEVSKQLNKMPFVIETPSLRRKQGALESKLREIENAIELFSKPKVYIAKNK